MIVFWASIEILAWVLASWNLMDGHETRAVFWMLAAIYILLNRACRDYFSEAKT